MSLKRTGPLTRNVEDVALGLAQIRVGVSATHIASTEGVLVSTDSIGALADTKYIGETEFWKLESGFPLLEDLSLPVRERSALECSFKELSIKNLSMARGLDPADVGVSDVIPLGGLKAPDYVRMESVYTFPTFEKEMVIIFPRANVTSSMEIENQIEDAAAVPIVFEAKRSDADITGGNAVWDEMPLGVIYFRDVTTS